MPRQHLSAHILGGHALLLHTLGVVAVGDRRFTLDPGGRAGRPCAERPRRMPCSRGRVAASLRAWRAAARPASDGGTKSSSLAARSTAA
ncbi:MAG: hypothetical protein MZV65_32025 [Chromatiales bacterium]|nr:hypothetical protein [Chromatiales bacterium]